MEAAGPGRRPADRSRSDPGLIQLQRLAGNRAVAGLLQRSMLVGAAGDEYEQEAEEVARRTAQRSLAHAEFGESAPAPSDVEAAVAGTTGGRQLPQGLRAEMEQAFGADP